MQGLSLQSLKKHKAVSKKYFFAPKCISAAYIINLYFIYFYLWILRCIIGLSSSTDTTEKLRSIHAANCVTQSSTLDKTNVCAQLIPLYVCTALGCGGALFYLTRLALRSPDVSWNKRTNPEPWQEYRDKQYKVYFGAYQTDKNEYT